MKSLLDIELVETERERGLGIIDLAETSGRTFEVQADVGVNYLIGCRNVGTVFGGNRWGERLHDGRSDIFAAVFFENLYVAIADLDFDLKRNAVGKERCRRGDITAARVFQLVFGLKDGSAEKQKYGKPQATCSRRIHRCIV